MIYLQRFIDDLFGAYLFDKKNVVVLTDQHGGKKQLVGPRDDHQDRMTCSDTRHLLTV